MEKPTSELIDFIIKIGSDVATSLKEINKKDTQYHRRNYARAIFSYIDGVVFITKMMLLNAIKLNTELNLFTSAEISILKEESYEIEANGNLKTRDRFLKTLPNFLFTFNLYDKTFNNSSGINTGCDGWRSLKKALNIRHRITHPKCAKDLDITDEEFDIFIDAEEFFEDQLREIIIKPIRPTT